MARFDVTTGPIGRVVILNGAPRSGKSSVAASLVDIAADRWRTIGVDHFVDGLPPRLRPGIGLRPGGERPDLESFVVCGYRALFATVAAFAANGTDVVVDVGVHDDHSRSLGIWSEVAALVDTGNSYLVGVRCSMEEVLRRRGRSPGNYAVAGTDGVAPDPVLRWQAEVHRPGRYDVEVDTTSTPARECARRVFDRLAAGPPTALECSVTGEVRRHRRIESANISG